jgi:nitric oxide reductase NorE protein
MTASAGTRKHIPGEIGIWMFIAGDVLIFSLFFVTYLSYRAQSVTLYDAGQAHLDRAFGLLNTLMMIGSSWCVATAIQAARRAMRRTAGRLITGAMACGGAFVLVKSLEYTALVRAGFALDTNEFFSFYFGLTGIHLLHVLVGLGVLGFMQKACRSRPSTPDGMRGLESGASFWHLVDLLWIMLFALLYLVK